LATPLKCNACGHPHPPIRITGDKIVLQAKKVDKAADPTGGASHRHKAQRAVGSREAVAWVERLAVATLQAVNNRAQKS
jgi:hypothetical protein